MTTDATIDDAHRPWPSPARPFAMAMSWHDLLFMHWPVDVASLRPHVPAPLAIDTFDGTAWLGVVPFRMTGVRPRGLPAVHGLSNFAELNVRTYVTIGGRPGVWFFSLDAENAIAVEVARRTFHLNYCHAQMRCERDLVRDVVSYASRRTHRGLPRATFAAGYRPTGQAARSVTDTLEHFLTERYCLYAAARDGRLFRGEIAHAPWPLRPAEVEMRTNTMNEQLGFALPATPPLLHFVDRLDVVAWKAEQLEGSLI
jgi:uncharacterized protein YqjF (DUF2071 family)